MSNRIAYGMQYIYYNRNGKQLICVYIHVHDCDLMETQKIEEAWLVLYREHS